MTAPADVYEVASGQPIYGGRAAPGGGGALPAWAASAPLNSFIEIPGTDQTVSATNWAGPHGNMGVSKFLGAWGAIAILPNGDAAAGVNGGHTDGEDNRMAVLRLMNDVPGWQTETAPSPQSVWVNEQPYYLDGLPAARHPYSQVFWSEILQRVIFVGAYAVPGTGNGGFPTMDGWDPVTKQWDPIGTYPYTLAPDQTYPGPDESGVWPAPSGGYTLGNMMDADGNVWGTWLSSPPRYSVATRVWDKPTITWVNGASITPRFPWALDTLRNQSFGMCHGDSQGNSLSDGLIAVTQKGTTITKITFNPSAALDQLIAEAAQYPGMDYDPDHDRFLFYHGRNVHAGKVYVIKPNAGLVWDVSLFEYPEGANPAPMVVNTGVNNRFRYIPQLKGFLLLPGGGAQDPTMNAYFMRTA